jgi:hypothetical protein
MTDTELKDLMERAVQPLEPMPDAVPEVLVTGRRSVRRRRALAAVGAMTGTAATVAAVTGLVNLTGGSNGGEAPAAGPGGTVTASRAPGPAGSNATGAATRAPDSNVSSGTPSAPAGSDQDKGDGRAVSQAMRDYHRRVAPVLDKALPDRFGKVTAERLVHSFTVRKGDRKYAITFRVDAEAGVQPPRCEADGAKGPTSCLARTLPNGWRAVGSHQPTSAMPDDTVLPLPQVETTYRGHRVSLFMFNDQRYAERVPISDNEMLDIFADPAFAAAIVEWASHPDWTDWGGSATGTASARPTR